MFPHKERQFALVPKSAYFINLSLQIAFKFQDQFPTKREKAQQQARGKVTTYVRINTVSFTAERNKCVFWAAQ